MKNAHFAVVLAVAKCGHPAIAIPVLGAAFGLGWLFGNHVITMLFLIPFGTCFVIWMTLAIYNVFDQALRFSFDSSHRRRTLAKIRELRPKP